MKNEIRKYYAHNFFREMMLFSAVLVPFFTDWAHLTLAQVQLLQSWFMVWVFLLEVPTGAVADFFGRKYSLALGGLVGALGALVYGSSPRLELFLIAEVLFAAAIALTSGADQAWLYDTLKDAKKEHESKRIFANGYAWLMGGIIVSGFIGSGIAVYFGLNAPMLYTAIPMVFVCLIGFSMKEPKRQGMITERQRYISILKTGIMHFSKHKTLRLLAFDAVVVNAAGYFVIWLYQPLLKNIGIPLVYFGIGPALLSGIQILIAANFLKLERLFGSTQKYFSYTAVLIIGAYLLPAILPNIGTVAFFMAVAAGFGLTRIELMSAYMHRYIPSEQRATVISSISMLKRFVLVILNPLIGFIATHSLSWALVTVSLLPLSIFLFSPLEQHMFVDDSDER